jgi:hypothetical protein
MAKKIFQLTQTTAALLNNLTARTEKSGGDDKPGISLGVRITVPNTELDMLDPDLKESTHMLPPGQKAIAGVTALLTKLRCPSIVSWDIGKEYAYEGWVLHIEHATSEPFKLGGCKVHKFQISGAREGGEVDLDFLISTSDCSGEIAGWLWEHQKKVIEIRLLPPAQPSDVKPAKGKAKKEDPNQGNLDGGLDPDSPEGKLAATGEGNKPSGPVLDGKR